MNDNNFSLAIIDDDDTLHFVVSTLVKREIPSAVIHSFENAIDFLKEVDEGFACDLILLDINMPRMDGWQLLDQLKIKNFDIQVYILSSSADARDLKRMNEYPIVKGYIVKPLTVDRLHGLLSTILA